MIVPWNISLVIHEFSDSKCKFNLWTKQCRHSGNRVSNNLAILINETGKGFLKAFDIVVCIVENKSNIIIIH